ncbi:MAG: hypothetical protein JNK34_13300 [Tabrizicola sp.]|nr:hypothetical protein [Tabrizicola sp.]
MAEPLILTAVSDREGQDAARGIAPLVLAATSLAPDDSGPLQDQAEVRAISPRRVAASR